MSQFDPAGKIMPTGAINAVTIASATTTNGASVDTTGWKWALVTINIGVVAGTTTGVSAVVAASSTTAGTFAAITGATFGAAGLLAGATTQVARIDLTKLTHDAQRWIRIQLTTAGASPSVPAFANIQLIRPDDSADQTVTYQFTI